MEHNYDIEIKDMTQHLFDVMAARVSAEDMARIKDALAFAHEAHKEQKRKTGAPYIIHPIAVATIAAEELKLDADSVITAFLHDVVEDTAYTTENIRERFGDQVAFLVDVVTKKKKAKYNTSKQVDNYQQLLDSVHYDIRALMVKIADRLHNMRTLSSMRPDKQMKIAGETDYFYAPLANRLGLYDVKTDLENLGFKYRCPTEYAELNNAIAKERDLNAQRLKEFTATVENRLHANGIEAVAEVYYRRPYSIWRKMKSQKKDFKHIDNKYYVRITFEHTAQSPLSEKSVCLKIYSLLTDIFKEKPQSFVNQIDQAKENSYQSLNVMLLSTEGIWEDVQICSRRMVESSKLGCMAELGISNVGEWMKRFKSILENIAKEAQEGNFLESVKDSLYYDDVMVFTPNGQGIIMPKGSTAIDFAFELHTDIGMHAKYARINGKLCSIKTLLNRGDCIEIGTDENVTAKPDWFKHACTYKAKHSITLLKRSIMTKNDWCRCPHCKPLPGGETIGFRTDGEKKITIHRRNCPDVISLASKHGDGIVAIDFKPNGEKYPVCVAIKGIDRYHLLIDLIDTITNTLHLSIDSLTTVTKDEIVDCKITFFVSEVDELRAAISHLYKVEGVDEVRHLHEGDKC